MNSFLQLVLMVIVIGCSIQAHSNQKHAGKKNNHLRTKNRHLNGTLHNQDDSNNQFETEIKKKTAKIKDKGLHEQNVIYKHPMDSKKTLGNEKSNNHFETETSGSTGTPTINDNNTHKATELKQHEEIRYNQSGLHKKLESENDRLSMEIRLLTETLRTQDWWLNQTVEGLKALKEVVENLNRDNQTDQRETMEKHNRSNHLETEIKDLKETIKKQEIWFNHTEANINQLKEILENQNRSSTSDEIGLAKLEEIRANQDDQMELIEFSNKRHNVVQKEVKELRMKQESWFNKTEANFEELKEIIISQNNNNQWKSGLKELKKLLDHQNAVQKSAEDHNIFNILDMGLQVVKKMVARASRQLQDLTSNRRNLTVLDKTIEVLYAQNGWIVIQHRFDGSVDFFRNWTEYRDGFGSFDGEFWLGLENIHLITSTNEYELLIQLEDFSGEIKYARYKRFAIDGEAAGYKLSVLGSYSGTAGNSLVQHRGMMFSTHDRDNDFGATNCAKYFKGAWWYRSCYSSNLNGLYKDELNKESMVWHSFSNGAKGLKISKIMIREL